MMDTPGPDSKELATMKEAKRVLKLSREYLYTLPLGTPGVYKFGRAKRFDLERLKAWGALGPVRSAQR